MGRLLIKHMSKWLTQAFAATGRVSSIFMLSLSCVPERQYLLEGSFYTFGTLVFVTSNLDHLALVAMGFMLVVPQDCKYLYTVKAESLPFRTLTGTGMSSITRSH